MRMQPKSQYIDVLPIKEVMQYFGDNKAFREKLPQWFLDHYDNSNTMYEGEIGIRVDTSHRGRCFVNQDDWYIVRHSNGVIDIMDQDTLDWHYEIIREVV